MWMFGLILAEDSIQLDQLHVHVVRCLEILVETKFI